LLAVGALTTPESGGKEVDEYEKRLPTLLVTHLQRSYPVVGDEADELRDQLRVESQWDAADGGHALTRSQLEVNYEFERSRSSCRLVEVQVSLQVTTVLPVWEPSARAPRDLRNRWDRMLAGLTRHEEGHAGHAKAAAQELRVGLADLPKEADSCRRIEAMAQRILFRVTTRLKFLDQRYDMRTRRGVGQGAVL
jgi:predicted secreted Zn-dependent protease